MRADESKSADELNAFLDDFVQGKGSSDTYVDPDIAGSAQHFHALGAIAGPDQEFVLGLEEVLMERSMSVTAEQFVTSPDVGPGLNGRLPYKDHAGLEIARPHRLRTMFLAAVSAVCLASVIGAGVYWLNPGPSPNDEIPAPVIAFLASPNDAATTPEECTVSVRTDYQFSLRGTPTSETLLEATTLTQTDSPNGQSVPAMEERELPTGEPAEPAEPIVVAGIERAVRELVACLNTGDFARVDALYSDDSFRRSIGHLDNVSPATPEVVEPEQLVAVPDHLSVQVLADGRVGVLLADDVHNYGLREFLIFARSGPSWLIDEQIIVTQGSGSAAGTPAALSIVFVADDFTFEPEQVTVPSGEMISITVVNSGTARHSFAIEELAIRIALAPGTSQTLEIALQPGTYQFSSDIAGQFAAGMRGAIVAVSRGTPDPSSQ